MNPDNQRIAIAEACGWKKSDLWAWDGQTCYEHAKHDPRTASQLPDYLSDLNAMHEAERTLNWDQQKRFIEWLVEDAIHDEYCTEMLWDSAWVAAHARASRRAEAFLRTIGKWEEA